jgi:hypothetical protein
VCVLEGRFALTRCAMRGVCKLCVCEVLRDFAMLGLGGDAHVDLRVSMVVRSCIFGLAISPQGSLARMASVGCMW